MLKLNQNLMSGNGMTCINVKSKLNFMWSWQLLHSLIDLEPAQIFLTQVPVSHWEFSLVQPPFKENCKRNYHTTVILQLLRKLLFVWPMPRLS